MRHVANLPHSTSPSAYIAIPEISAANSCNQVGSVHYSTTLAIAPGQLSTMVNGKAYPFEFTDVLCPPASVFDIDHISFIGQGYRSSLTLEQMMILYTNCYSRPIISPPPEITDIDPAWKTFCYIDAFQGNDPPIALQEVSNLMATTTSPHTNVNPTPASPVSTGQGLPDKTTSPAVAPTSSSQSPNNDPGNSAGFAKSPQPAVTGGSVPDPSLGTFAGQGTNSGQGPDTNEIAKSSPGSNSNPTTDPNRALPSVNAASNPVLYTTRITLAVTSTNVAGFPTTSLSISTLVYQDPSGPVSTPSKPNPQNLPSTQQISASIRIVTSIDAAGHPHSITETTAAAATQAFQLQTAHIVQAITTTDASGSHVTQLSTSDFVYQIPASSDISSEKSTSKGLAAIIAGALGFSATPTQNMVASGARGVSTATSSFAINGTAVGVFTGWGCKCKAYDVWGMGVVVGIAVLGVA